MYSKYPIVVITHCHVLYLQYFMFFFFGNTINNLHKVQYSLFGRGLGYLRFCLCLLCFYKVWTFFCHYFYIYNLNFFWTPKYGIIFGTGCRPSILTKFIRYPIDNKRIMRKRILKAINYGYVFTQ
jgi:hypothetical protein